MEVILFDCALIVRRLDTRPDEEVKYLAIRHKGVEKRACITGRTVEY